MPSPLPCSPRKPVRVVPQWRVDDGQATPPTFFLRIPQPEDRANIESDLFVAGARPFFDGDLHRELKRALKALIDPEPAAQAANTIDEFAAALATERERVEAAEKAAKAAAMQREVVVTTEDAPEPPAIPVAVSQPDPRLAELTEEIERFEEFVSQHWEQYRVMLACRNKRVTLYPLYTARCLLMGWDGLEIDGKPAEFKAGIDGRVKADLWASLDERDKRAIGWEGVGLLHLTPSQRGN